MKVLSTHQWWKRLSICCLGHTTGHRLGYQRGSDDSATYSLKDWGKQRWLRTTSGRWETKRSPTQQINNKPCTTDILVLRQRHGRDREALQRTSWHDRFNTSTRWENRKGYVSHYECKLVSGRCRVHNAGEFVANCFASELSEVIWRARLVA